MEMPSSPSCELGMMVEGSGLVLRAHVLRTRPSTITCAVPLVGIRLGGTVRDERGRRARIRRIALATDHDTPQLIFELAYEGEPFTVEGASSPSSPPHSLHQLPF
ncbi:MAG: hypothetical protein RMJ84_10915, partial [Sandaracinaceae bacterium]|nr:hypothetical protein [Sandaracinaceae bacterium]